MRLKLYLVEKGISFTDFCKELGCCRSHITGIANGKIKPSRLLAKEIERQTGGVITAEQIMEDFNKKPL